MIANAKNSLILKVAGTVAALFGLATIASGGTALFGGEAARAAVGNAVSFVLWFNFLAGFLYVIAGVDAGVAGEDRRPAANGDAALRDIAGAAAVLDAAGTGLCRSIRRRHPFR